MTQMEFKLEAELLAPVQRFFMNKKYVKGITEAAFSNHRIDLLAYSTKHDVAIAIELKLKNWKKALQQALIYQLCTDYSYLAMPEKNIKSINLDTLSKYGIGLIVVKNNGLCEEVLKSKKSKCTVNEYKRQFFSNSKANNEYGLS